jgi:uncharacterized protein YbaA (DUF1428 family)
MTYVDGFLAAVPTANRNAYLAHAAEVARIFRKHGALRVTECWGDDVPKGERTDFFRAVDAREDETVVFSWIEWSDKSARDAGMQSVMTDMTEAMREMPFDGKRMVYGGFQALLDEQATPAQPS